MTNEQAAARQAAHECLMRELVEVLRHTASTLRIACIAIADPVARRMAMDVVNEANELIARAKEQQQ